MIYLSRDGCCGIVNRDVVKLEVDLHCEKKPPCFPFPVKPKQKRNAWGVHSGTNTPDSFGFLIRYQLPNCCTQTFVVPASFHFQHFPQLCVCLHFLQAPHLKK